MSPLLFPGGREEEARVYTEAAKQLLLSGRLQPAATAPARSGRQVRDQVRDLCPEATVYADGPHGATAVFPAALTFDQKDELRRRALEVGLQIGTTYGEVVFRRPLVATHQSVDRGGLR